MFVLQIAGGLPHGLQGQKGWIGAPPLFKKKPFGACFYLRCSLPTLDMVGSISDIDKLSIITMEPS